MQEIETTAIGTLMEPEPIGFSFDAPGWLLLFSLLLLLLSAWALRRYLHYRRNKYRRIAVGLIESLFREEPDSGKLLFKTVETMKRVSQETFGRGNVSHLQGLDWIDYLEMNDRASYSFSPLMKRIFSTTLYQTGKDLLSDREKEELRSESITWIKKHHV